MTTNGVAEPDRRANPRWRSVMGWLVFWTFVGLAFTTRTYLVEQRLAERDPWDWMRSLRSDLPDWYLWGLIALIVPRIARRFPLDAERWRANAPIHVAAGLVLTQVFLVAAVLVQGALRSITGESYPLVSKFVDNLLIGFLWHGVVYAAILGYALTVQYRNEVQAQAVRAVQLESRLAQARLDALALQLRPHFLFNTLNGIAELMHADVEAADRMLTGLAELLRRSLAAVGGAEVALDEELVMIAHYVSIQRVRFEDRLRVDVDVTPEAGAASVPSLVLLPLIENAVMHGVSTRPGPASVGVRARRAGDDLVIEVWDDGPGLAVGANGGSGIGLANTRERLFALYGRTDALTVEPREPLGVVSRLCIPYRVAA